jgi:predicted nucleic acid-binding protein
MSSIVISDASCLIALNNIGLLNVLNELYYEVLITQEVKNEFGEPLPIWIKIVSVQNLQKKRELEEVLDAGEASSIALSLEIEDSILIIDELKGRKIASSLNIKIIGTIGILILAYKKGLIKDLISVILKLVNNGFRLSDDLLNSIVDQFGKR